MRTENTLLARQPIFDKSLKIVAYELLFRTDNSVIHQSTEITESVEGVENVEGLDGDRATSVVMLNAYTEIGIRNLVGNHKAFINFTRNLILSPPVFGSNEIVIEVLENVDPDPEVIDSLRHLKKLGYTIALDDFVYEERFQPLIELADIIKIDVLALTDEELQEHVTVLGRDNTELLAEKVETLAMYERCRDLGFDYFQGFFLSKPKDIKGHTIGANKLVVVELLGQLNATDSDVSKIHAIVSKDPALSFKLLRMINSAAFRRPHKIESLQNAIVLLGLGQVKRLASLLALSNLNDKPSALYEETMVLAKMCEFLGKRMGPSVPQDDLFFTIGMLSMLDAFFDVPLDRLLESVSMSDEVNAALLRYEGVLGLVLFTCKSYEKGEWTQINWSDLEQYDITIDDVKQAYLDSLSWTIDMGSSVLTSIY